MASRNNISTILLLTVSLCIAYYSSPAISAEPSREKVLSEAINKTIHVGKPISLDADGSAFIGILNENMHIEPKGTVILLHGLGGHPNTQQVIQPLRNNLTEHGWVTLSIQLPVLDSHTDTSDYLALLDKAKPRIAAALHYIDDKHPKPLVIIGYSLGALMASSFLADQTNTVCNALVTISSINFKTADKSSEPYQLLKKIKLPILDIYGSQDLSRITLYSSKRKQAFIKNNPDNRQVKISGADHSFTGLDDDLHTTIQGWLSKTLSVLGKPAI